MKIKIDCTANLGDFCNALPVISGISDYRNENILCAVLALLKELDENGLELVKRDIERKIQTKK